mgnify:CR=1 FL=1
MSAGNLVGSEATSRSDALTALFCAAEKPFASIPMSGPVTDAVPRLRLSQSVCGGDSG